MSDFQFIDYSQYKAWMKCPWYWYERYVNKVEKKRTPGKYRDDALAIGSLVHSGLEMWAKTKTPRIEQTVIEEIGPSPEALLLSTQLVQEYVKRYPNEEFDMERTEVPLTFKLDNLDTTGLALVDNHFYNPIEQTIESGIPGEQLCLTKGWWIREYKTKDAQKPRDLFEKAWQCNMQANFQLLALRNKIQEPVRGILVCVLEKPRLYIPRRKCKGCGELNDLSSYLSTGDGHACIMCGFKQQLKPYEPKVERSGEIYRIHVQRNDEQLEIAFNEIKAVARKMEEARRDGPPTFIPDREKCIGYGECEFYNNHTYGKSTLEDDLMEQRDTTRYVRLEELVQIEEAK